MRDDLRCDVAIIGAGTAGLSAERSARRVGASTLLIDPEFRGTTCANVGCMPSKLLIAAASAAHGARRASVFGIHAAPAVDGVGVMRRLRELRDDFAEATREEIAKLPEDVRVWASARFQDSNTLLLDDGRLVRAGAIVIATGSRPSVPEAFQPVIDLVLTNETIYELVDLPQSLAVIGAGPLGLELAQALARLGVAVTLLDKTEKLAGMDDGEIAGRIKAVLERDMKVALGVEIVASMADGRAQLSWTGSSSGEASFDRILVAAGRPPNVEELDLSNTHLELDDHGVPVFDRESMRCGTSSIYIAGDADADRPVLHEASSEGALAGANAASHPQVQPAKRCVPFSIMFTDPPLALIGRRDDERLVWGVSDYRDQGRAKVEDRAEGLVRIYADAGSGRITGAALFCPGADHLGHLLAWSIETGATAQNLLDRPFYHPTFEEGLKPALRAICKQTGLHTPEARDEGAPPGG